MPDIKGVFFLKQDFSKLIQAMEILHSGGLSNVPKR